MPGMTPWADAPRLMGVKVLVVEGNPEVRETVKLALEEYGALVTAVDSPADGLARLERDRPDVLVSNLFRSGWHAGGERQDGYWLIRQIRHLSPDRGGETPAVAFTGCTSARDRFEALRAGFQFHVPKPADLRELAAAVAISSLRRDAALASPRSACPATA
jgi:CheY-like chemotaxis protein